eukprot:1156676-Pelagomonas_calceolata.AAC.7
MRQRQAMRHNGSHLLGGSTAAKATAELGLVGTGGTSLVSRGAAAKATTLAAVTLTVAAEAATATEALAAGGACAGGGALQGPAWWQAPHPGAGPGSRAGGRCPCQSGTCKHMRHCTPPGIGMNDGNHAPAPEQVLPVDGHLWRFHTLLHNIL